MKPGDKPAIIRLMTLTYLDAIAFPQLRAENIPEIYLHEETSHNGDWKRMADPYETGFNDYSKRTVVPRAENIFADL